MIGGNCPLGAACPARVGLFVPLNANRVVNFCEFTTRFCRGLSWRRAEGAGDGLRVRRIPEIPGFQRLQMQHLQTVFHRATAQFPLMEEASFCGIVDEII